MTTSTRSTSVSFFCLNAFSRTGGIEKFNRSLIKALADISAHNSWKFEAISAFDDACDSRYIDDGQWKAFAGNKSRAMFSFVRRGQGKQVIILGHINLSVVALAIKILSPSTKIVLVAHGIESWRKHKGIKKWCLRKVDLILAVSNFTKNQLILRNRIKADKIHLFPNTLDPFFKIPVNLQKPQYLLDRYQLSASQPAIFTLSRLLASEQKKGYDTVIHVLPRVVQLFPDCIYILAGRFDTMEKKRIEELLLKMNLVDRVKLPGYLSEDEVVDHYKLADVFVLPSRKEGFGIVFLEALACGTPTIGGNQDGTVDALLNGSLGQLVNPENQTEVASAIIRQLSADTFINPKGLQNSVLANYRFSIFEGRLKNILSNLINKN